VRLRPLSCGVRVPPQRFWVLCGIIYHALMKHVKPTTDERAAAPAVDGAALATRRRARVYKFQLILYNIYIYIFVYIYMYIYIYIYIYIYVCILL